MMKMGGNNQVCAQNEGDGEGSAILKKGPWTATEDVILAEYVRTHGEGNWNAVQTNTGLARCGKSCRLRWANHLRPNLKKGAFSPEEERLIIELHAKMGNKWARMATQLPGRTDNEIKNYWNTRIKRRQRQGLPIYPPDIQPLHSQYQRNQHRSLPVTPITSPTGTSTTMTSSFSFQLPMPSSLPNLQGSMPMQLHPLHIPRSESSHMLYNPHSTPPPLQSPGRGSTPPPLPSPSPSTHVSPLQSPHKPLFSTLPVFDSSTSNTCSINANYGNSDNNNHTISSDFFFPRATPLLEISMLYKRFKHDVSESCGSGSTGSSFMLPYPPLQKNSFFNPHNVAATVDTSTPLTSPHYSSPSYSLDPITLYLTSSSRILDDQHRANTGQFILTPGFVYPSKTNNELPSNQFFFLDGNSDVTFDTNGNSSYINNDQTLSIPFNEGGLLDDMLEEARVLASGDDDIMRRQSCVAGFSTSSDALASAKEETVTDQEIIAIQEDYSELLDIPSSMAMPDWFDDCERSPTVL